MSDKFVTVFTHLHVYGIELAKAVLEKNNIVTMIKGYDEARPSLAYNKPIELQVPEKDKEKAGALIGDIKKSLSKNLGEGAGTKLGTIVRLNLGTSAGVF